MRTRTERADLHAHPIPEKMSLRDYALLAEEHGISILTVTNFGSEDRFGFYARDKIPSQWDRNSFQGGFVLNNSKNGVRQVYIHSQEIPTQEGHVLLVGGTRNFPIGRPVRDTIREARLNRLLIVADHPFIPFMRGGLGEKVISELIEGGDESGIDALESNAQAKLWDERVFEYAKQHLRYGKPLPVVANSDFHQTYMKIGPFEIPLFRANADGFGQAYTVFPSLEGAPSTYLNQMRTALQLGNTKPHRGYAPVGRVLLWNVASAYNNLRDKIRGKPGSPG